MQAQGTQRVAPFLPGSPTAVGRTRDRRRWWQTHTPPQREHIDVAEAGRRYLDNRRSVGLKHTTLGDYESFLRVHLAPFFTDIPLDEITIEDVEAFIKIKRSEGKAVKSISNYVGLLGAIFAFAVRRGLCEVNPVIAADRPRVERERDIRFLTLDELNRLLDAVPEDVLGPTERVLYLTAAMTGLRRGELLALRWQDIDRQVGVLRVRRTYTRGQFGTPKSRRSNRAVPLAGRVIEALDTHQARSPFTGDTDMVFCHPQLGTVLDPSKVLKRFKAAGRRAGLRQVRFHDLRHTFGTQMAAAGAPLRAIQDWLGHSDLRVTLLYADYAPDQTQGAMWAARAFGDHRSSVSKT